ncbi:MAG TPA: mechanosensitive ion channel family protein, partial [Blastocatellia bacterium]
MKSFIESVKLGAVPSIGSSGKAPFNYFESLNNHTFKIISLLSIATLVAASLHWLVGLAQRRLAPRLGVKPQPDDGAQPSFRQLMLDWTGKALRILVWLLYFTFLINLLPQTRRQFGDVGERLQDVGETVVGWLANQGVNLVILIVVTVFLMRFASALINTIFNWFDRGEMNREALAARRRLQTLSATFRGITQTIIVFIGLIAFLRRLNIDVTSILLSASVLGIAVGLGAQSLIRDFFAGFLILLEDQFSVGDTVKIGETTGTVEQLTLRVTRLRALDGSLTMIPNGSIGALVNYSKGWSRVVLDVEIDYREDVDRAMRVMLETAKRMREDSRADIIEEPSMLGVDKLGATGVTLRLLAKTAANRQADVGRELRRRVKLAFDREGIKTASSTPQLVLPPLVGEMRMKGEGQTERPK